jgi:NAD(P)-dependent dehydrogenase (short-subunit alcohol dehydrogenase family)
VGYATAKVLADASKDFHVIMTGRSIEKVKAAKAEIEATGIKGTLVAVQLDINSDESVENAVKVVEKHHGRLDALINNAAVVSYESDLRTRLRQTFETNVIGCAAVAEAFRPLLLKSSNPYSVFVSSGMGSLAISADPKSFALPYDEAYRASKAALNIFTVMEKRNYNDKGVKAIAMCPGFVVSNLRGTSEEARNPGGAAGDPAVSGKLVLSILSGERDGELGSLVHKDGVYPW